jgi:hypothetical protein
MIGSISHCLSLPPIEALIFESRASRNFQKILWVPSQRKVLYLTIVFGEYANFGSFAKDVEA